MENRNMTIDVERIKDAIAKRESFFKAALIKEFEAMDLAKKGTKETMDAYIRGLYSGHIEGLEDAYRIIFGDEAWLKSMTES